MGNIIIVGANQGIGYYMVERLLELGNSVTVLDIQIDAIEKLQKNYPKTVLPILADAKDFGSIENGAKQAMERFGNIDIAIHNACLCVFENELNIGFDIYKDFTSAFELFLLYGVC